MHETGKGNTAAIILAAGFGTRLKSIGPKPLLKCKGKSFIEIAVEKAIAIQIDPIILVTNHRFEPLINDLKLPTHITINEHPEKGMLSSILTGMKLLPRRCDGFFMCPIDYPLVKFETYKHLLEAHYAYPNRIIKPVYQQKPGHPVIVPSNLFSALYKIPENESARYLFRQNSSLIQKVHVYDPGILFNINTPELFHQYCK